jgi:alkylation response protein AidB-like acyl-CoA dehydrogenase
MDLTLSEDQQAIADLAGKILRDKLPPERLTALEQQGTWFDANAWRALAEASLLGAPLAEDVRGGGFGVLEACLVLEQIGATAAPLPFLATVVMAAMAIDRFGSPEQRQRLLPGVADGSRLLSVALCEEGCAIAPQTPRTAARRDGVGFRLDGEKRFVQVADLADLLLVPARTDDGGVAVLLVDRDAPGVSLERGETTAFEPQWTVRFSGTPVDAANRLGSADGRAIVDSIVDHAIAGLCATSAGACGEALRLTSKHVSEREQFGQKIAMFQAVAHRAADAYVDLQAISLCAHQAAWRLGAGLPAQHALASAKFWAAEGGQRVVHAAQHLHGGIGVDTSYPLHRSFRLVKQLELSLGGAAVSLQRLGQSLAAGAAPGAV